MFPLQRSRYRIHGILILSICVLLFSAVPAQVTKADATVPQEINNTVADFKDGQFQRAALSNILRTDLGGNVTDKLGGVQLGPVGLIKVWKPGQFTLPKSAARPTGKLYNMGAAAIGSRIFIIGGLSPDNSNVAQPLSEVWSVGVSPIDGALLDPGWQAETPLPAVQGSDQGAPNTPPHDYVFTDPVSRVESPAVAAISTDASGLNGYIYVIGGNVPVADATDAIYTFSSYAVRIGTVTNGHITGWLDQIGAHFPILPGDAISYGVQQAQAVTVQVGSKTYLYVIGGLQRRTDNQGTTRTFGLNTVFYAQIGSGGKLFKPSSPGTEGWDRAADIPVPVSTFSGLWDASVVADNFVASNQTSTNALYVIGGQLTPSQEGVGATYSEKVYQALIKDDGSLQWNPAWQGVLPAARSKSSAATFRGNIYMAGGVPSGGNAENTVLTSYVEDNLRLHQFTNPPPGTLGDGSNFLQSDPNPVTGVLTKPRKQHASVLVRADANSPNSAFLFVLGGIGDGSESNGADTVLYGKIGGGEDVSSTGFAADGWFYAPPVNVAKQFAQVQLQEVDWTTIITSTDLDIALDYRLSLSNDCNSATWGSWQPLQAIGASPHFSVNGANKATIPSPTARCFQYRTHFSTAQVLQTPLLLNVSVMIRVPGSPDLKLGDLPVLRGSDGALLGVNVVIQNKNLFESPTLAADAEQKGTFWIDLCIFKPGVTPVKPTIPLPNPPTGTCSTAYAQVNRAFLPADQSYTIPQWHDTQDPNHPAVVLKNYFKEPGVYNVIVVVDSLNNVNEGDKGGETNNVSDPIQINFTKGGYQLSLPVIDR